MVGLFPTLGDNLCFLPYLCSQPKSTSPASLRILAVKGFILDLLVDSFLLTLGKKVKAVTLSEGRSGNRSSPKNSSSLDQEGCSYLYCSSRNIEGNNFAITYRVGYMYF